MARDDLDIEKKMLLLARVDHEQFLYFYEKYYDSIFRFLKYRVLHREVVEDLTSETFARALDKLGTFRWKGVSFGAWLYRIASNLANSHFKKADRLRIYGLDLDEQFAGDGLGPMAVLLESEDQRRLYAALAELDELSINIFVLFYWEDFSVRQIAAALGTKEGTVQSRLFRERDKMAGILKIQKDPPEAEDSLEAIQATLNRKDRKGGDDA